MPTLGTHLVFFVKLSLPSALIAFHDGCFHKSAFLPVLENEYRTNVHADEPDCFRFLDDHLLWHRAELGKDRVAPTNGDTPIAPVEVQDCRVKSVGRCAKEAMDRVVGTDHSFLQGQR